MQSQGRLRADEKKIKKCWVSLLTFGPHLCAEKLLSITVAQSQIGRMASVSETLYQETLSNSGKHA